MEKISDTQPSRIQGREWSVAGGISQWFWSPAEGTGEDVTRHLTWAEWASQQLPLVFCRRPGPPLPLLLAFNQFTSSACLTLGSSFHLKWSYRDEFYFHISSTTSWNYSLLSGPEVNTAMHVKKSMACVLYWKLNVWEEEMMFLMPPEVIFQNQGEILKYSHADNQYLSISKIKMLTTS